MSIRYNAKISGVGFECGQRKTVTLYNRLYTLKIMEPISSKTAKRRLLPVNLFLLENQVRDTRNQQIQNDSPGLDFCPATRELVITEG